MILGQVVGSVVATIKEGNITGLKLLIVAGLSPSGEANRFEFIAADTVGAGVGDKVLVVTGSSARFTDATRDSAVDATIIGVVDRVDYSG